MTQCINEYNLIENVDKTCKSEKGAGGNDKMSKFNGMRTGHSTTKNDVKGVEFEIKKCKPQLPSNPAELMDVGSKLSKTGMDKLEQLKDPSYFTSLFSGIIYDNPEDNPNYKKTPENKGYTTFVITCSGIVFVIFLMVTLFAKYKYNTFFDNPLITPIIILFLLCKRFFLFFVCIWTIWYAYTYIFTTPDAVAMIIKSWAKVEDPLIDKRVKKAYYRVVDWNIILIPFIVLNGARIGFFFVFLWYCAYLILIHIPMIFFFGWLTGVMVTFMDD